MKKNGYKPSGKTITARKTNFISTILLILFMLIYLVGTIVSSNQLAKQTEIISQHPFEVTIAAEDIKLYTVEMKLCTERLLPYHEPEELLLVRDEDVYKRQNLHNAG